MGTNRLWLLGSLVLVALMLAGTFLLGVSPQLAAAGADDAEARTVQLQNVGHQQELDRLREQFADIDSLRSDLEDLRQQVPEQIDQDTFLDEIGTLAAANGVSVDNISFEVPAQYLPTDASDPEVIAATASVTSNNLFVVPVSMSVTGPVLGAFAFVKQLQKGTRLFLLYELTIEGTDDDPATDDVILGMSGQIFVLNNNQAPPAPTAPVEGSPTPG